MPARRRERGRVSAWLLLPPVAALALGGCAAVGTVVTSEYVSGASALAWIATGKTLSDHALSVATGSDCNLLSGLASSGRDICEAPGAVRPGEEFRGVLAMLARPPVGQPATASGPALAAVEFAPPAPPPGLLAPEFASGASSFNAYVAARTR